ncbi:MAG: hypothetical protein AAGB35_03785 [Pseudomonadota bacterium]
MLVEIIILIVILAILLLPIKLAAEYVGANNTGLLMCIAALLLAGLIQTVVEAFFPLLELHFAASALISLLLSAFAYMVVLDTTYGKGIAIAIIQIILTFVLVYVVGLMGISLGTIMMQLQS